MIKSVNNYPVSSLLDIETAVVYAIPRYQREYKWGKWEWDALFDDLLENDLNYFLGSIICINQSSDALSIQQLELVDGQQRMTTLSILLSAIYSVFSGLGEALDLDAQLELRNLKHRLILKKHTEQTRLVPQVQNFNQQDYFAVLNMAGVLDDVETVANAGNRRVFKAYRHFIGRLEEYLEPLGNSVAAISELLERVNSANLVKIEVASHSDAYTLFESLNNRGVPLTAIDLIKNKLLAKLEQEDKGKIDKYFNQWMKVIDALSDDYATQERFFRQYYNAFKPNLKDVVSVPVATKSNLIHIYEKLISHDAAGFLKKMIEHSSLYSKITAQSPDSEKVNLSRLLLSLERVQGVPSYLLLLLLFSQQEDLEISDGDLELVIDLLITFFVRRNTTDTPPTRDLTRLFMDIAENILPLKGGDIYSYIVKELSAVSANDETFEKHLSGKIYEENKSVCRYVLCAIEETNMTRETQVDLWAMQGKQYIWTIEHIFPQGENIPNGWIDMIANGDTDLAEQHRQNYVHKLGNLTISGYNSALGNKSFIDKRDREDKQGRPVGYKNGLFLNTELAKADTWSIENIKNRTQVVVDQVVELFKLPTE